MAIFFDYIKGCGPSAKNDNTNAKECWTFLKWADISEDHTSANALPTIYSTTNSTFSETNNLGKIITSKATGQVIDKDFIFNANLLLKDFSMSGNGSNLSLGTDGKIIFSNNGTATFKSGLISEATIKTEILDANNKCQALYFNATSDRRAKDNIRLSTFNGLDLVKALQIYNFNYAEQKTPSIGIMAQDAAKHDIEDFELVTNKEATGENGDFMSIKESKLVYVLWKAVQELSAEVDDLKAQLKNK